MKKIFTKRDVERLFEKVIDDIKENCHQVKSGFYIGKRKIGLIRYFLSIRLEELKKGDVE